MLKLITYSLDDKCEQYNHPQPVSSSKTCGVEQWEWGEERTSERYQRSECQLPFPSGWINQHFSFGLVFTKCENHAVAALYEHQEHEQGSKQAY